jgi:CheY-like chemotaxis protein
MSGSAPLLADLDVLVLEDESMVWLALEDMLLELGCRPTRAIDVPAALSMVECERPGLAILDVNIAGETSYPVAACLDRLGVPIVFSTGSDLSAMPERWRGRPLIGKPFSQQKLMEALALAVDAARQAKGQARPDCMSP